MISSGDVVVADFRGARGIKRRPAVVMSTDTYHQTRPDVILALLTMRVPAAVGPTDYVPQDWAAAGLHSPSVFHAYFAMELATALTVVGHLTDRDWQEIQARLRIALAVT